MSSSPILTLPAEVLSKIFVECLPERNSERLNPNHAPMLLCRVNSWWRQTAHGEHALWSVIIFPTTPGSLQKSQRFIKAGHIDTWFGRTGQAKASEVLLTFGEDALDTRPSSSLINEYIGVITKYAGRFRHLSIVLSKIPHFEWFRRAFPHDVYDELRSVSLCCSIDMNPSVLYGYEHLTTPFVNARKLKYASFTLIRAHPMRFVLPWKSITRVDVRYPRRALELTEWKALFDGCPGMEEALVMRPTRPGRTTIHKNQYTEHRKLRRLTMVVPTTTDSYMRGTKGSWGIFAGPVHFVALKHLELVFEPDRCASDSLVIWGHTASLANVESIVFRSSEGEGTLAEALTMVRGLVKTPFAIPRLKEVEMACRSAHARQVVNMLRAHPPSETYDGMKVTAKVAPGPLEAGNWKLFRRGLSSHDRAVVGRLHLKGISLVDD